MILNTEEEILQKITPWRKNQVIAPWCSFRIFTVDFIEYKRFWLLLFSRGRGMHTFYHFCTIFYTLTKFTED